MVLLPLPAALICLAQQPDLSALQLPASASNLIAALQKSLRLAQVVPPKTERDPAVLLWLTSDQRVVAMRFEWERGKSTGAAVQLSSALNVEHSMMELLAASEDLHSKYGGGNYAAIRVPPRTEEGKKNLKYRLRLDDLRKLSLDSTTPEQVQKEIDALLALGKKLDVPRPIPADEPPPASLSKNMEASLKSVALTPNQRAVFAWLDRQGFRPKNTSTGESGMTYVILSGDGFRGQLWIGVSKDNTLVWASLDFPLTVSSDAEAGGIIGPILAMEFPEIQPTLSSGNSSLNIPMSVSLRGYFTGERAVTPVWLEIWLPRLRRAAEKIDRATLTRQAPKEMSAQERVLFGLKQAGFLVGKPNVTGNNTMVNVTAPDGIGARLTFSESGILENKHETVTISQEIPLNLPEEEAKSRAVAIKERHPEFNAFPWPSGAAGIWNIKVSTSKSLSPVTLETVQATIHAMRRAAYASQAVKPTSKVDIESLSLTAEQRKNVERLQKNGFTLAEAQSKDGRTILRWKKADAPDIFQNFQPGQKTAALMKFNLPLNREQMQALMRTFDDFNFRTDYSATVAGNSYEVTLKEESLNDVVDYICVDSLYSAYVYFFNEFKKGAPIPISGEKDIDSVRFGLSQTANIKTLRRAWFQIADAKIAPTENGESELNIYWQRLNKERITQKFIYKDNKLIKVSAATGLRFESAEKAEPIRAKLAEDVLVDKPTLRPDPERPGGVILVVSRTKTVDIVTNPDPAQMVRDIAYKARKATDPSAPNTVEQELSAITPDPWQKSLMDALQKDGYKIASAKWQMSDSSITIKNQISLEIEKEGFYKTTLTLICGFNRQEPAALATINVGTGDKTTEQINAILDGGLNAKYTLARARYVGKGYTLWIQKKAESIEIDSTLKALQEMQVMAREAATLLASKPSEPSSSEFSADLSRLNLNDPLPGIVEFLKEGGYTVAGKREGEKVTLRLTRPGIEMILLEDNGKWFKLFTGFTVRAPVSEAKQKAERLKKEKESYEVIDWSISGDEKSSLIWLSRKESRDNASLVNLSIDNFKEIMEKMKK